MRRILIVILMMVASRALALEWNTCIEYLTRNDPTARWVLQDDGQGPYIKKWDSVVAQPTEAEVIAIEPTAIAWKTNKDNDTKSDYENWSNAELKATLKLLVKEINKLRALHGLSEYNATQVKAALKAELE